MAVGDDSGDYKCTLLEGDNKYQYPARDGSQTACTQFIFPEVPTDTGLPVGPSALVAQGLNDRVIHAFAYSAFLQSGSNLDNLFDLTKYSITVSADALTLAMEIQGTTYTYTWDVFSSLYVDADGAEFALSPIQIYQTPEAENPNFIIVEMEDISTTPAQKDAYVTFLIQAESTQPCSLFAARKEAEAQADAAKLEAEKTCIPSENCRDPVTSGQHACESRLRDDGEIEYFCTLKTFTDGRFAGLDGSEVSSCPDATLEVGSDDYYEDI